MDKLQWFDYLRMGTVVLALLCVYVSVHRAYHHWGEYTDRLRGLWWALNSLLLLMVEGSIEQILQDVQWGARTLLGFIVALGCFVSIRKDEGYTKTD